MHETIQKWFDSDRKAYGFVLVFSRFRRGDKGAILEKPNYEVYHRQFCNDRGEWKLYRGDGLNAKKVTLIFGNSFRIISQPEKGYFLLRSLPNPFLHRLKTKNLFPHKAKHYQNPLSHMLKLGTLKNPQRIGFALPSREFFIAWKLKLGVRGPFCWLFGGNLWKGGWSLKFSWVWWQMKFGEGVRREW